MSDWWNADPVYQPPKKGTGSAGDAIARIESGGRYDATGPVTRTGDRAYGKYQVMGANIGPWSKEVFGEEVSPQDFVANPEIQDAIFSHKFGQYEKKYGRNGAARAWFAGEGGMNDMGRRDQLGTSVADYERKFAGGARDAVNQFAPQEPQAMAFAPSQTKSGDNWWANDPVAGQQPAAPNPGIAQSPIDARFPETTPQNDKLQGELQNAGRAATTGPALPTGSQITGDFLNQGSAAAQGTTPNIDAQYKNLISDQVSELDSGEVMYKDPATGKLVPTDQNKHVALRDPKDGRVKVFARTDDTDEGRLSAGGRLLGTGMGAGAVTARPAIPVAGKVQPAASDVFATSKPYYRAFKNEAGQIEIPEQTAKDFAVRIRGALDKGAFTKEFAGPIYSATEILEKGGPQSLSDLQYLKQVIGKGFKSSDQNVRDAATAASKEVVKIINEVAPEAGKNLKKADNIHSTALALQDLQRKSSVADLRAGRAGYGGNAVNSMRQVLSPIIQRSVEGKSTLFKPEELEVMRGIVEGTGATNAARLVGQMSPFKGSIPTTAAAGAMYAAGPAAIAIPALGMAGNKLATVLTGKQIDRLKELVAKRSPAYSEAVSKATTKWEKAQTDLAAKPSSAKFAAYLSSSRALASGLQRDGVEVTSADLLKLLQSPGAGRADEDEVDGKVAE